MEACEINYNLVYFKQRSYVTLCYCIGGSQAIVIVVRTGTHMHTPTLSDTALQKARE